MNIEEEIRLAEEKLNTLSELARRCEIREHKVAYVRCMAAQAKWMEYLAGLKILNLDRINNLRETKK